MIIDPNSSSWRERMESSIQQAILSRGGVLPNSSNPSWNARMEELLKVFILLAVMPAGSITNVEVAATAAIAWSKLSSKIGYDIILVIGQSNAVGNGSSTDPTLDTTDPRILQYPLSGGYAAQPILANDPLWHPTQNAGKVGFAVAFAREYVKSISPARQVLLIPGAVGSTGFAGNRWNPTNDLFVQAVSKTNEAIALDPINHRLVAMLWLQGEADVTAAMSKAAYITALDAMIAALRSQITGATNVPFLLGEMVSTWISANASKIAIQAALNETINRIQFSAIASGRNSTLISNNTISDPAHYSAASQRTLGKRFYARLESAFANTGAPGVPSGLISTAQTSTTLTLKWDYPTGFTQSWVLSYKPSSGSTWTEIAISSDGATHEGYTLTGLTINTSYDLRLKGVNSTISSAFSSTLTVLTRANYLPAGTPTPLVHLRFGGDFNDSSGANRNASLIGSPEIATNISGRSSVGRLTPGNNLTIPTGLTTSYTKACWFRGDSNTVVYHLIGSIGTPAIDHAFMLVSGVLRSGHSVNSAFCTSDQVVDSSATSGWVHAAVTYDAATTTLKLYRNGTLVSTNAAVAAPGADTRGAMGVGSYRGEPTTNALSGYLDELLIFNSALSASQVLALFEQT